MSEYEHQEYVDQGIGWTGAVVSEVQPTSNTTLSTWWRGIAPVSFVCSVGFLFVAIGDTLARFEYAGAEWIFLLGLIITFVPPALRLISVVPSRSERIALVVVVGLLYYGVKVLHSPIRITYYDEYSHRRTVIDI